MACSAGVWLGYYAVTVVAVTVVHVNTDCPTSWGPLVKPLGLCGSLGPLGSKLRRSLITVSVSNYY